jgi:hypothetical protein
MEQSIKKMGESHDENDKCGFPSKRERREQFLKTFHRSGRQNFADFLLDYSEC